MNLDFVNNLVNGLKKNKFVQDFAKELENYVEENAVNNQDEKTNKEFSNDLNSNNLNLNDLNSEELKINGKRVISKYRDEILLERANILQSYAKNTKEEGEMYYIYSNSEQKGNYNLSICDSERSHEVITESAEELPNGAKVGSVLRKKEEEFVLDNEATEVIEKEINSMIQEKLKEQDEYLDSKRIEGHIYEAGEKGSDTIWLYDTTNAENGMEGIEEIEFPKDLYEIAQEGDYFIYKNGEYQKYEG